ncbi:hypothetical protein [Reinekea sp. G2M2-21]|uniref:hypothetical protein n=1 Tax=Reinekea sp. G2M2-21 TaxID=2788942 RepID=UPI0018A95816|nr:hypothetical protein [Reinekea sp. G2M2-21]
MTSKRKDGDCIILYWDEMLPEYEVFKGHVSKEHVLPIIMFERDLPFLKKHDLVEISHKYGRWSIAQDEMGDPIQRFKEYDEPGRGRFKATLVKLSGYTYEEAVRYHNRNA